MTDLARYREETADASAPDLISWASSTFSDGLVFASSLGVEDQVITHLAAEEGLDIQIITLDTGRMFPEVYDLIETTRARYSMHINLVFPEASDVEELVQNEGPNLFYRSVENRKRCCHVRKVKPLRRVLAGKSAWMTGLRRSQSASRTDTSAIEWDEANGLYKVSPLIDWSESDVWEFVREHDVPYNPLHDRGFRSIGCAPCTRAVKPGEDARSGRWWWELPNGKECGIHTSDSPAESPFGITVLKQS